MIWNIYFTFHQTQNEFKKNILFFRNFNRKYIEKNYLTKLAIYVPGQMRIVQNNLQFIFRFVYVNR